MGKLSKLLSMSCFNNSGDVAAQKFRALGHFMQNFPSPGDLRVFVVW